MPVPPLKAAGAMLVLVALLGACVSPKPPPPKVNLGGFPPAFRDGYADTAVKVPSRARRDDATRRALGRTPSMRWAGAMATTSVASDRP